MSLNLEIDFSNRMLNARLDFYNEQLKSIELSIENINKYINNIKHNLELLNLPDIEENRIKRYSGLININGIDKKAFENNKLLFEINSETTFNRPIEWMILSRDKCNNEMQNLIIYWQSINEIFENEYLELNKIISNLKIELANNKNAKLKQEINDNNTIINELAPVTEKMDISGNKVLSNLTLQKNIGVKEKCGNFAKELGFKKDEAVTKSKIEMIQKKLHNIGINTTDSCIRSNLNNLGYSKKRYKP